LQYLYDLVNNELGGNANTSTSWIPGDRYTAPNGKVYMISHNGATYTSPDFMFPKTFTTLAAMESYINVNNGGWWGGGSTNAAAWNHVDIDNTWQAAPYKAPNGKIYYLFKTVDDRYSSYNFVSAKYFDSTQSVIMHININNPK
jgi:hypothetical protein